MKEKKSKRQLTLERSQRAVQMLDDVDTLMLDTESLKANRQKIASATVQFYMKDDDGVTVEIFIPDFLHREFKRCIVNFAEENADKMDVAVKQALLKAAL